MSYQPGDIVNGHVLGADNQWHPLPADATQRIPTTPPTTQLPAQPGGYPAQPGGYPAQPGGYPGQTGGYPVRPGGPQPPKPVYRRGWFWAVVVVGLLGAGMVVGIVLVGRVVRDRVDDVSRAVSSITVPAATPRPSATSRPSGVATPKPSSAAPASVAPVGSTVHDGSFDFTVTGVDCTRTTLGSGALAQTADGHYCLVDVDIANVGTHSDSFLVVLQSAVSAKGEPLDADPAVIVLDGAHVTVQVAAGQRGHAVIVFDTPDGGLSEVVLTGDVLSDGVRVKVG